MGRANPLRGLVAGGLLLAAFVAGAAQPLVLSTDGWHSWSVAAPANSAWRCCGCGAGIGGRCDQDPDGADVSTTYDPDDSAGDVRILARLEQGQPTKVEVLGLGCRVRTTAAIQDHGPQDTAVSVAWLRQFVVPGSRVGSEALAAIAAHDGADAFRAIVSVVESRAPESLRQEALFWLIQSGSDEGFSYLDRLLTAD